MSKVEIENFDIWTLIWVGVEIPLHDILQFPRWKR
jgi:hypothetical protein